MTSAEDVFEAMQAVLDDEGFAALSVVSHGMGQTWTATVKTIGEKWRVQADSFAEDGWDKETFYRRLTEIVKKAHSLANCEVEGDSTSDLSPPS